MKTILIGACAALSALLLPAAALAQAAVPAPAPAALDPVRLAEAHKLIDLVMPPASRDQMVRTMIDGLMGNIAKFMNEDPTFSSQDPQVRAITARSTDRMQKEMLDLITAMMPEMSEAMSHAYARRFSVEELQQMEVFFASPAGQAYVSRIADLFSDPDIVAWQRAMTQRQMARMPEIMDAMRRDVEAAAGSPKAKQGTKRSD